MAIRTVQLGIARNSDEGLRIVIVRRPPRGVRKEDYSKFDYYDVWMPELAPRLAQEGDLVKRSDDTAPRLDNSSPWRNSSLMIVRPAM